MKERQRETEMGSGRTCIFKKFSLKIFKPKKKNPSIKSFYYIHYVNVISKSNQSKIMNVKVCNILKCNN